jgi:hypothetical protein
MFYVLSQKPRGRWRQAEGLSASGLGKGGRLRRKRTGIDQLDEPAGGLIAICRA